MISSLSERPATADGSQTGKSGEAGNKRLTREAGVVGQLPELVNVPPRPIIGLGKPGLAECSGGTDKAQETRRIGRAG
jgi:hypothetical protein